MDIILECQEDETDLSEPEAILIILNDHIDKAQDAIDFSVNDDRATISEGSPYFTEVMW